MEYVAPMTKLSDEQANELIRKRYEEDQKTWEEIAKELAKTGYVSRKNKQPLPVMTVRYRYYANKKEGKQGPNLKAQQQIDMIRKMIALKADEKVRLTLIQSVLDEG